MCFQSIDSGRIRLATFVFLIIGWLALVGFFWDSGNRELGAAAIGAGPLALYSFYDEVVNQPVLTVSGPITYEKSVVRGYVDGPTLTEHLNTQQPVLLNEPIETVYPIINVNVEVKNKGLSTAESATTRVLTELVEPFFARWGDEANEQSISIHPGMSRTLTLMRITPRHLDFQQFLGQDEVEGHEYMVTRIFDVLEPGYSGDGVLIDGIPYYIQHPIHQNKERRKAGDNQGTFFGKQMPPNETYKIEIEFGAAEWGRRVDNVGTVSLPDAVTDGEWESSFRRYNRYDELVTHLEEHGW
ncbi:hypothetical protein AMS69_10145 [Haloarcula rubripromontorii]|uniref:Uncharacterized protein n=1 Tax=Haloarcula rubripromontorii TaxID=1705562 RepID=A0A0N0BNQ0_9EURY|nr:hypothetical protein [Haloarcula rubripromontorii]KOX92813.1 hypothetical protein AMS69_10145 [Haloarcula rubripromontorii]